MMTTTTNKVSASSLEKRDEARPDETRLY
jgi:hypothetical protein